MKIRIELTPEEQEEWLLLDVTRPLQEVIQDYFEERLGAFDQVEITLL